MLSERGVRESGLEGVKESAVWKRDIRVLSGRRVSDCWLEERESECCLEEGQESAVWKKGERALAGRGMRERRSNRC